MTTKKKRKKKAPTAEQVEAAAAKASSAAKQASRAYGLASRAERATAKLTQAQKSVLAAAEGVDAILDPLRSRMADLRWLVEVSVLKVSVLTEISYLTKNAEPAGVAEMHARLMRALEEPGDWWIERSQLTLGQWVDALLELDLGGSPQHRVTFEDVIANVVSKARQRSKARAAPASAAEEEPEEEAEDDEPNSASRTTILGRSGR